MIYIVQVINSDQGYAIYSLICMNLFFGGHSITRTLNFFAHLGSTYLKCYFRLEFRNNSFGMQIPFGCIFHTLLTLSWKCIQLFYDTILPEMLFRNVWLRLNRTWINLNVVAESHVWNKDSNMYFYLCACNHEIWRITKHVDQG